jgi:hypothetical protein
MFSLCMNLSFTLKSAINVIKCKYLVVISNSKDSVIIRNNLKTPSLTLMMRSKEKLFLSSCNINFKDFALSLANEDFSIEIVK